MNFKEWLSVNENANRTGAKIGLYPDIEDLLGQYPPLYGTPYAADYVTYLYIKYGANGPPSKNGIMKSRPGKNVTDRYLPPQ